MRPELNFSKEGRFKIVQFTDTHLSDFVLGDKGESQEVMARRATKMRADVFATIRSILDTERPDMVIFTGDNVLVPDQTRDRLRELVEPAVERKIPWAIVMGNHDTELTKISQRDQMAFLETLPFSLCTCGPDELGSGGNYVLRVLSHGSSHAVAAIYCMDSGDYADH